MLHQIEVDVEKVKLTREEMRELGTYKTEQFRATIPGLNVVGRSLESEENAMYDLKFTLFQRYREIVNLVKREIS